MRYDFMAGARIVPKNRPSDRKKKESVYDTSATKSLLLRSARAPLTTTSANERNNKRDACDVRWFIVSRPPSSSTPASSAPPLLLHPLLRLRGRQRPLRRSTTGWPGGVCTSARSWNDQPHALHGSGYLSYHKSYHKLCKNLFKNEVQFQRFLHDFLHDLRTPRYYESGNV